MSRQILSHILPALPSRCTTAITRLCGRFLLAGALVTTVCVGSASAQAADVFGAQFTGGSGDHGNTTQINTHSQSQNSQQQQRAPGLQGTYNAVFASQGMDATEISGVNTAGTVRVNNMANCEALLNIIANGLEILGLAWGAHFMSLAFMHVSAGTGEAKKKVLYAAAGTIGGMAAPGIINWLVASARDANLFS